MQIVEILIPKIKLFPLLYKVPLELTVEIGDLVVVPFKNTQITGIVFSFSTNIDKIRNIRNIIKKSSTQARLDIRYITMIKKTAEYYMSSLGSIAKLILPIELESKNSNVTITNFIKEKTNLFMLSEKQKEIVSCSQKIDKPIVIKGVTGSGKTEIYFDIVKQHLVQNQQVLILLPEIGLATQMEQRFQKAFNMEPAKWNSTITNSNKRSILKGVISGDVKILIGTRSALFLPYKNLSLIILDEEHDASYKQNTNILYHARDMAILRSNICNNKIILISATPSLETIYNCNLGKYHLLHLTEQFHKIAFPEIKLIKMKNSKFTKKQVISDELYNLIQRNIENQNQTLLFINRRGYAPLIICKSCNYRCMCSKCSIAMTVHQLTQSIQCHYCGNKSAIPKICPECKEDNLIFWGIGIEKLAEETEKLFPKQKIFVLSSDYTQDKKYLSHFLDKMNKNEIDILIATQMISKGYHFPNLTLAGIIDADIGFFAGDLRSCERSYQLLYQLRGRIGREKENSILAIQTFYSDNKIINYLKEQQEDQFIQSELLARQNQNMPPFTKAISITLSGKNDSTTNKISYKLVQSAPINDKVQIFGPTEAAIHKISDKYFYKILVIVDRKIKLQHYLATWLQSVKLPASVNIKIDIDAQSFF